MKSKSPSPPLLLLALGVALFLALPACADDTSDEPSEEIFTTTGLPNYRIPAIACTRRGTLVAVADYRYGGNDIGYGSVELRRRISRDNGATWGDILEFTHGQYATSPKPKYDAAYGDPCIVADRNSDSILVLSCSGNTGFPNGTREVHQGIARFYSTDEGVTWSEPSYIQDAVYALFDHCSHGPVRSLFIGSGKIHQSRYVKIGATHRLYCSVIVKDVNGTNCNYVIYSDDFGGTWSLLGDGDTPPIPSGDEPKAEELPDGSVICSSRVTGGRKYNIFTFSDVAKGEGSWGECATSNASNNGVVAAGNSCNGEIMVVPAIRKADGEKLYVALQSVPFGYGASRDGRDNVGIYYKELYDRADFGTPADLGSDWDGRHQATYLRSAYSTMCMQADGRVAFLYEETTHNYDYSIIYKPYSLEDITGGLYAYDADPQRYAFMSRYIDEEVSPFYSGSVRIVGAPDPTRRSEVDAAVARFKANPCEETYNDIFATMTSTIVPLQADDTWYAFRNYGRGKHYMKNISSKLTTSVSLISSGAGQHFRFLRADADEHYYLQCARGMSFLAPTGTNSEQLTFVTSTSDAGIYTIESNLRGQSLIACLNPEGTTTHLTLNETCDKVLPAAPSDASRWYVEATDYIPTSIEELSNEINDETPRYDLNGRRVTQSAKGILITKNKKMWIK